MSKKEAKPMKAKPKGRSWTQYLLKEGKLLTFLSEIWVLRNQAKVSAPIQYYSHLVEVTLMAYFHYLDLVLAVPSYYCSQMHLLFSHIFLTNQLYSNHKDPRTVQLQR